MRRMMTEKERKEALNDETNFFYTRRFPYRDGDPIKITLFEFYGLRIYKMDIYTTCFNYAARPQFYPGWQFRFYFTDGNEGTIDGNEGTIEILSKTEVLARMKEAEVKEATAA